MGRRNKRNNGGILSGITSGIENDLGLGGGGGRRNRGGGNHATAGDIVHDGMKYAAIYGVAQQGFKAWGQRNGNGNNSNNPRDMDNGQGGWMSAPPSMQQPQAFQPPAQLQYQQQQRYIQYADRNQNQYPQQQQRYIQNGGENQGYYQQQQRVFDQPHDRGLQRDDDDEDDAPPAYVEESPLENPKGHQPWCNGGCGGACMQR